MKEMKQKTETNRRPTYNNIALIAIAVCLFFIGANIAILLRDGLLYMNLAAVVVSAFCAGWVTALWTRP